MAQIKPFGALRYQTNNAGKIETLTCPPYDIISEEQREAFLRENPYNVIRLELPRGEEPYAQAGKTLEEWLQKGVLAQDETPAVYIYEEEFTVRGKRMSFRGFICRVQLEEFSKGIVLPHEETLSKAKADRFALMQNTFCNFSQIYSLYMDEERRSAALLAELSAGAPDIEMTDGEGVTHRLWIAKQSAQVDALCASFAEKKLYIADGHHRYETALNFRNWCREQGIAAPGDDVDSVMMMLVDMADPGLVVFPTHRLVRGLEQFDAEEIKRRCAEFFDVTEMDDAASMEDALDELYRQGKKAFGFYTGTAGWTQLVLRDVSVMEEMLPGKSKALRELDVSVLHTLVLERVMGIDRENMAQQINLTYTRVYDEALSAVRQGAAQCSFVLNPTRVEEIRDVAAAGEKMPQKSTYFYPKLITGLVMNRLK